MKSNNLSNSSKLSKLSNSSNTADNTSNIENTFNTSDIRDSTENAKNITNNINEAASDAWSSTAHIYNSYYNNASLLVKSYLQTTYQYLQIILEQCAIMDKLYIILYVTRLWALSGIYVARMFEYLFRQMLKLPDGFFALQYGSVKNTQGKQIDILYAHDGTKNITNKFKLFLKLYFEKGGLDSANDTNGFDFRNFSNALGCSMLYCCYLLNDKGATIHPDEFLTNIKKFMIEQRENGQCFKSADHTQPKKVPMRHVDFEE